jgi:hypothetical protein
LFGIRNKTSAMTLRSALQDVKETTLSAVSGLLGKLVYLASLRRGGHGRYEHWGMTVVHGQEPSERALKGVHAEVVSGVLRTPLPSLLEDLQKSSEGTGFAPDIYVEQMRERFDDLLPGESKDSPSATHLNSVLAALSSLQKNQEQSTPSAS